MARKYKCKWCKRKLPRLTKSGFCPACAVRKNKMVIRQLHKKKGKYYKSWKLNLLEAIKKQPM